MNKRHWIFLRGLSRHSSHWGLFLDKFKKTFPNDQIELLDSAGNGERVDEPSFNSIEQNVIDLREHSKFIQAKTPVHLMTISMGSMIGVEWARLFPHEIEGLVCINTSGKQTGWFWERLSLESLWTIVKIAKAKDDRRRQEELILKLTTSHLADLENIAQEFAKHKKTAPKNSLRQAIAASQYIFPKTKPIEKILMLAAKKDRLASYKCTLNICNQWALLPHIHPEAGHDIPLEDPDWVIEKIKAELT